MPTRSGSRPSSRWPCQTLVLRRNTNRRNAQNRKTLPSSAPTTFPAMLSASAVSQPNALRLSHRQLTGMTNDARFTPT